MTNENNGQNQNLTNQDEENRQGHNINHIVISGRICAEPKHKIVESTEGNKSKSFSTLVFDVLNDIKYYGSSRIRIELRNEYADIMHTLLSLGDHVVVSGIFVNKYNQEYQKSFPKIVNATVEITESLKTKEERQQRKLQE